MLQRFFLFVLIFGSALSGFSQATLRGRVVNEDGQPLEGAVVSIPALKKGAYTNSSGIYSIDKVPLGDYEVFSWFIGFDTAKVMVYMPGSGVTTEGFVLKERIVYTDEVVITSNRTGEIQRTEVTTGVTPISPSICRCFPVWYSLATKADSCTFGAERRSRI